MAKKLAAATAAKYDKVPVLRGAIQRFPRALREIAKVSVFGSEKHEQSIGSTSYLDVPGADDIYADAEGRHMLAEAIEGPRNYEDGDLLHKAQKAWNALADLEVFLRNQTRKENDA